PAAEVDAVAGTSRVAGAHTRTRRCGVRSTRSRLDRIHPFARRLIGSRERAGVADGIPLRLVRVDAPLSTGAAGDRGRAAAQVLPRCDQPDLSPRTGTLGQAPERGGSGGLGSAWNRTCGTEIPLGAARGLALDQAGN